MNKNSIVGTSRQNKGVIKESLGRLIGSTKLRFSGKADQAMGSAQHLLGTVREFLKIRKTRHRT